MKFFGQHAQNVAQQIVDNFRNPENLPKILGTKFIRSNCDVPCARWSMLNQFMAYMSGTTDARGMKQWNKVGRKITKGSKAVWILAPITKKRKEEDTSGEDKEKYFVVGFKAIPVFRYEDTEGEPLPETESLENHIESLPLLEVAQKWGIKVYGQDTTLYGAKGMYRYNASDGRPDEIVLGVENLDTWCHELVHAADKRIGGLKEKDWHREVVADLGSAILLYMLGRPEEADLGGCYQYLDTYAKTQGMDVVKACITTMSRTCECVELILQESGVQVGETIEA